MYNTFRYMLQMYALFQNFAIFKDHIQIYLRYETCFITVYIQQLVRASIKTIRSSIYFAQHKVLNSRFSIVCVWYPSCFYHLWFRTHLTVRALIPFYCAPRNNLWNILLQVHDSNTHWVSHIAQVRIFYSKLYVHIYV